MPFSQEQMPKQLWLLAGGNGAGKSTFYRIYLQPKGMHFVNADNIARNLAPENTQTASYEAAQVAQRLRFDLLDKGVSFCFETVFSHSSKIDFMGQAKALGYEIILIFIHLINPELNKARVAQRVSEGGHSVPETKIETRIPRTLSYVKSALPLADEVHLLDNSTFNNPFQRIAKLTDGKLDFIAINAPPWALSMLSEYLPD